MNKFLKYSISIILILIIIICSVELGLRFLWFISPNFQKGSCGYFAHCNHPLLGEINNPNFCIKVKFSEHPKGFVFYRMNNQGLREDLNTSYKKPANTIVFRFPNKRNLLKGGWILLKRTFRRR